MSELSAQSIRARCLNPDGTLRDDALIEPFHERTVQEGRTFGLSGAGYDVRIRDRAVLGIGGYGKSRFVLASTIERFRVPNDLVMDIMDKSTNIRTGLSVQNTRAEPGWQGYLTLELFNMAESVIVIPAGTPIAQVTFRTLDEPTEQPYAGKYQNQKDGPQAAIWEK